MQKKKKQAKVKWETVKYKSIRHSKNANAVLIPDGKLIFLVTTKAGKTRYSII